MVKADVTKYKEVENLFNESVGKFGKIDLLVNNAGKVDDCYLMMLSSNTLDKLVDINLKSVYYCCKQAAIRMCKKGGKIINVSSVAAIKGMIGQSVYSGTKGAINSMTAVLAKELIQFGIIVNAVAPGFIDTNMTEKFTLEKRKKYEEMIPAKRFGRSEDIANLVAYLASNISDYIVGQVIYVDGGLSI